MQDAAFSGVFAALSAEHRLNYIANNLANSGTSGYKQDHLAFKDTMIQFAHDQIMEPMATIRSKPLFPDPQIAARTRIAAKKTDFSQGTLQFTGNPLDVAITGQGFFQVRSPQGDYLTRNGAFCQTADGMLVTKQGWPVLGQGGGTITIPEGTRTIHFSPEGRVFADGEEVGALQLTTVSDFDGLEKLGGNLYRLRADTQATEEDALADDANVLVNQGFLEASNVNVVTEMVKMIEVQRQFEAYQKVIQTSDALDRDAHQKVGRANR